MVKAMESLRQVATGHLPGQVSSSATKPPCRANETESVDSDLWLKPVPISPRGRTSRPEILAHPLFQSRIVQVDLQDLKPGRSISSRTNEELVTALCDLDAVGTPLIDQLLAELTTDLLGYRRERVITVCDVASDLRNLVGDNRAHVVEEPYVPVESELPHSRVIVGLDEHSIDAVERRNLNNLTKQVYQGSSGFVV